MRKRLGVLVALAAGAVLLGGCTLPTFGARTPVSKQGSDSIKLWQGFFIAGAIVFILVFLLILFASLRYRRRRGEQERIPRQTQYHTLIEILYTSIPVVIVLVLFAFTFVTENNVDALPKPKMAVTVTAFQWGWQFTYTSSTDPTATHEPGYKGRSTFTVSGVETQAPELVLPANETVRLYVRSADVIHGFYVPDFDYSVYAQPGVTNKFTVNLKKTGVFRAQCTQFCGLYHSLMRFRVESLSSSTFATWLAGTHASTTTGTISALKHQIASQIGGGTS